MARTLPNNLTPPRFISAVKVQRHRLMRRSVCAWQVRTMREAILLICFSQQKWVRTCRWYSETVELAVHDVSDGESRPCCVVDKPRSHLVSLHLAGYIERDIYARCQCTSTMQLGKGDMLFADRWNGQRLFFLPQLGAGREAERLLQATNKCMQVPCFVSWPDGPTQMRNS
jgi:hypothetical protein